MIPYQYDGNASVWFGFEPGPTNHNFQERIKKDGHTIKIPFKDGCLCMFYMFTGTIICKQEPQMVVIS